jgi:hypothetical protein
MSAPKKSREEIHDEASNGRRAKGTQHLSLEVTTFAISALLFQQRHPDVILSTIRQFFEEPSKLPSREQVRPLLDGSLKEASELVSGLQIMDGFLRNRTPQGAVSFCYIVCRYALYQGRTPTREESIKLWQTVWGKAKTVPMVAREWEEMERRGDLKGWIADIQEAARRQLRTFKTQLPRVQRNAREIYITLLAFLFDENQGEVEKERDGLPSSGRDEG